MDKAEILRYLRCSSKTDNKQILDLVDSCIAEAKEVIEPKTIYRIFPCKVNGNEIKIGDYVFTSSRLAGHIDGCDRAVVFGATLGTKCDELLRKYTVTDIARASAFQAVLASYIEEVCDSLEETIKEENPSISMRSRYSPGYFDLDIHEQSKIFEMMDITKRTGITLTDTFMMVPTKSVTAIIGIEKE